MHSYTSVRLTHGDAYPAPYVEPRDFEGREVQLRLLPQLSFSGPPHMIRELLQAGLTALGAVWPPAQDLPEIFEQFGTPADPVDGGWEVYDHDPQSAPAGFGSWSVRRTDEVVIVSEEKEE